MGNIGNMIGKTLKQTASNTAKGTKGVVTSGTSGAASLIAF